jgi:hypothetical protein
MDSFQLICTKVFRFDLHQLLLFTGSDILCYATDQDSVVIKRIADKTQKIGTAEMDARPISLSSGRNGRVLAVGMATGTIKLYAVSSANVAEICTFTVGSVPVKAVGWVGFGGKVRTACLREDKLLVKSYASPMLEALSESGDTLSLAWGVTDKVVLLAQGMMPIADLPLEEESEVIKIACFEDFKRINVLSKCRNGLLIHSYDTSVLSSHTEELNSLTFLASNSSELLRILSLNLKQITLDWRAISHLFHVKFTSAIQSALEAVQVQTPVHEVLLQTISTGMATTGLSQFLKNDIHSFKALVQFDERISLQVKNLIKSVLDGVLHIAQRLVVLWSKLRGLSRYEEAYSVFGLDYSGITTLLTCNFPTETLRTSNMWPTRSLPRWKRRKAICTTLCCG